MYPVFEGGARVLEQRLRTLLYSTLPYLFYLSGRDVVEM